MCLFLQQPAVFDTPTFNLTGPSTMAVGSSAVFSLDMYITKPSTHLSVDAFAPLNNTDVMSICGMKVRELEALTCRCGWLHARYLILAMSVLVPSS